MLAFASGDLWTSLAQVGIGLIVLAIIGAIAFWRGKRKGSTTLVLDIALTVSGWWVTLSLLGLVLIVAKTFSTNWVELGSADLWMPLPADLPCVEGSDEPTGPSLSCGGATLASPTVYDVSIGIRLLSMTSAICALVISTLPPALIAVICFQTLRGRGFSRTVTRALIIGATMLLAVGIAGELLQTITSTLALREVFAPDSPWYPAYFKLSVSPVPVGGAIALAALAAVFHQGMRLQAERDQLQRDTEGLV